MIQIVNALFQIVFSLLETLFSGIGELVVSASPSKRKENYNADFLPANKLLSANEKGFCLTGDKSLSVEESFSNAVCFGGSGSGKSSRLLLPSILRMTQSSLVVHDPSGELFQKTASAMVQNGFSVKVLNYIKPDYSESYNPLHRVKTISDIKKISKLLIHTSLGGGGKDPFWNSAAEGLVSVFIRYTIFHTEKEFHTLYNVLCLLNAFSGTPQKIDKLFVRAKDDDLLADYKAYIAYDIKMLMSIVATARTALSLFADPEVARVTSLDSIDFESFRKHKTILYISNDVNSMKYYSVLSSIFFEQFFASVMNHLPNKVDIPVFFLLDEASSLYLSVLPVAISNIRKYNSGILQIYQSQSQLFDLYGIPQGRNILANSYAKVYMPGQPLETARELELLLGKFESADDDNNKRTRQLLTMDEIRILKEAIILIGNYQPIKTMMIPYYEQSKLKRLTELPVYTIESNFFEEGISQINIDGKDEQKV